MSIINDENIINELKEIAKNNVPEEIDMLHLFHSVNIRQTLFVQIINNKIYLFNGLKGEYRHKQILQQLFNLLKKTNLPNCVFKYITADHVCDWMTGNKNIPVFSHAKLINDPISQKIMVPSFSDLGYTTGKNILDGYIPYDIEIRNIIEESIKWVWEDKESTMMFKGYVGEYPHRLKIIKELNDSYKPFEFQTYIRGPNIKGMFQHPIKHLCRYRYQLLMNGCGTEIGNESFSIRTKYMLATNSICIYIHLGIDHLEWWMDELICKKLIIKCSTVNEAIKMVTYYEENPNEAKKHLEKQREFCEKYLMADVKDQYWLELLKVYSSRCNFTFEKPLKDNDDCLINENVLDDILKQEPINN